MVRGVGGSDSRCEWWSCTDAPGRRSRRRPRLPSVLDPPGFGPSAAPGARCRVPGPATARLRPRRVEGGVVGQSRIEGLLRAARRASPHLPRGRPP